MRDPWWFILIDGITRLIICTLVPIFVISMLHGMSFTEVAGELIQMLKELLQRIL